VKQVGRQNKNYFVDDFFNRLEVFIATKDNT